MKPLKIATFTLLTSVCLALPALAQRGESPPTTQVISIPANFELLRNRRGAENTEKSTQRNNSDANRIDITEDQVIQACVQGKPETLPIPFRDLSPNDWAFRSVMNLYYCGAIGPNTPPEAIEVIRNNQRSRTQTNTPHYQNNTTKTRG